ncbi:MAG: thioredoxin [Candidatus Hadarchaeales archaeon]
MLEISDTDFDEVVRNNRFVVVDFWAPWCPPCRALAPVMEELSKEYEGRVQMVKINVDQHRVKAKEYGIMSIPTLLFFREGKLVDRQVGAVPKSLLREKLEQLIGK